MMNVKRRALFSIHHSSLRIHHFLNVRVVFSVTLEMGGGGAVSGSAATRAGPSSLVLARRAATRDAMALCFVPVSRRIQKRVSRKMLPRTVSPPKIKMATTVSDEI